MATQVYHNTSRLQRRHFELIAEIIQAIRLMVHQLAYICDIGVFDRDIAAYGKALDECEGKQ